MTISASAASKMPLLAFRHAAAVAVHPRQGVVALGRAHVDQYTVRPLRFPFVCPRGVDDRGHVLDDLLERRIGCRCVFPNLIGIGREIDIGLVVAIEDDEYAEPAATARLRSEDDFRKRAGEIYAQYADRYRKRFRWLGSHHFVKVLGNVLMADATDLRGLLVQLKARGVTSLAAVTGDTAEPTRMAWRFSPKSNKKEDRVEPDKVDEVAKDVPFDRQQERVPAAFEALEQISPAEPHEPLAGARQVVQDLGLGPGPQPFP